MDPTLTVGFSDELMYDIRLAKLDEAEGLQAFIGEHWRRDHIFAKSKALLDWQHRVQNNGHYNFIVGIDLASREIHGVLGFIPLSQFDAAIPNGRLCWMAIWKVRAAARGHKLGRDLMAFLADEIKPDCISTVGATEMTLGMYAEQGYQVGRMVQHYILHPAMEKFALAALNGTPRPIVDRNAATAEKTLSRVSEDELRAANSNIFERQRAIPQKTLAYIINRYCRHPLYRYTVYHIVRSGQIEGLIVTRTCEHRAARAIRVVEFIGPNAALIGLGTAWLDLLISENAEYVDFYSAGIPLEILADSGFHHRRGEDRIVVPNYFEPFTQETVEIDYMISADVTQPFRIVKGDSDQDRPNILADDLT